jgi:hypothetical protein
MKARPKDLLGEKQEKKVFVKKFDSIYENST